MPRNIPNKTSLGQCTAQKTRARETKPAEMKNKAPAFLLYKTTTVAIAKRTVAWLEGKDGLGECAKIFLTPATKNGLER